MRLKCDQSEKLHIQIKDYSTAIEMCKNNSECTHIDDYQCKGTNLDVCKGQPRDTLNSCVYMKGCCFKTISDTII